MSLPWTVRDLEKSLEFYRDGRGLLDVFQPVPRNRGENIYRAGHSGCPSGSNFASRMHEGGCNRRGRAERERKG